MRKNAWAFDFNRCIRIEKKKEISCFKLLCEIKHSMMRTRQNALTPITLSTNLCKRMP